MTRAYGADDLKNILNPGGCSENYVFRCSMTAKCPVQKITREELDTGFGCSFSPGVRFFPFRELAPYPDKTFPGSCPFLSCSPLCAHAEPDAFVPPATCTIYFRENNSPLVFTYLPRSML
jgi:hypothetical protein